ARRARRRGHDLPEEGPGDPLHRAAAVADLAGARGRSGAAAGALAGGADHGAVDLHLLGGAEHGVRQIDVQPQQRVLPPTCARDGASARAAGPGTEERLEDVVETPEAAAESAGAGAPGLAVDRSLAAHVVELALLPPGPHLVGPPDLLELLSRFRTRDAGVLGSCELPVGLLDLLRARLAGHAEDLVVVVHRVTLCWGLCSRGAGAWGSRPDHPARIRERYRATARTAAMVPG